MPMFVPMAKDGYINICFVATRAIKKAIDKRVKSSDLDISKVMREICRKEFKLKK